MTVFEDLRDRLGDKEDFRPITADDQQETVCNLVVGVDGRIRNKTGKLLRGGGANAKPGRSQSPPLAGAL